jgi:hypothetical protein
MAFTTLQGDETLPRCRIGDDVMSEKYDGAFFFGRIATCDSNANFGDAEDVSRGRDARTRRNVAAAESGASLDFLWDGIGAPSSTLASSTVLLLNWFQ